jgi:hypothetical protein
MADFAKEFLKHAVDQGNKKKGKKVTARSALSAKVSHSGTAAASSGSPTGKVTSLLGTSSGRVPKRPRGPEDVIDVDADVGSTLPQCHEVASFLDDYPLKVSESEKKIIIGTSVDKRGEELSWDAAGLIRILEKALTLNEAAGKPSSEVEKLKGEKVLLETDVLELENRVQDFLGKQENFVRVTAELREKETELERLREEVKVLQIKAGEKDELEREVAGLKAAMVPVGTEPDATRGLLSRADLVEEISSLGGKLIAGAKFAFENAVEQIRVLNGDVEIKTEGIGFWRKVEDGQVILPDDHKAMELQDQDDDEEEDDDDEQKDDGEEGHGESH